MPQAEPADTTNVVSIASSPRFAANRAPQAPEAPRQVDSEKAALALQMAMFSALLACGAAERRIFRAARMSLQKGMERFPDNEGISDAAFILDSVAASSKGRV